MVSIPSGFSHRQLPRNYSLQDWRKTGSKGMILHVAVGGDVSLFGWFSNPAARASSTWWAGKSGRREQYMDPLRHRSWAQAGGNDEYHSIETSGNPWEPLSREQIDACAAAYAWGHREFGWPFRLAERPGERGLGWHGMGGSAWGGHPDCPGELRKAQRAEILQRAKQMTAAGDGSPDPDPDDMELDMDEKTLRKIIREESLRGDVVPRPEYSMGEADAKSNPTWRGDNILKYLMDMVHQARSYAREGSGKRKLSVHGNTASGLGRDEATADSLLKYAAASFFDQRKFHKAVIARLAEIRELAKNNGGIDPDQIESAIREAVSDFELTLGPIDTEE